ncbi:MULTISPECIES: response regulator [Comamonas]|jgi:two-component system OmpR family response regulator|uniref:DNA-binding response regulator n=1 Tax=Comamonas terrigena TaxID=32013 RepID=A0A2A7UQ51_COMTR|nr:MULTISPECIES: response regulator transcription factor [Comamonas]MBP7352622.1 response regulator transcription factor [Comamonas sp.]MBD9533666.1 response regulator transcription factor [Comamonas sp. CMM01]MDH0049893.1 response regulator transcription factor [Comamonas terrigena]MDH0511158.1 response regulator transcription factor [Comamonas terrigena]MDH1090760.1 response regulator transcription factor [Comamonas terrigena]
MRILLVEDDAALAQAVLGYLHSKQFKVDLAPDLTTARALVAVTHYATILLDLNLPDGDGLELLQHLPRRDDAPTVVVVTARDQVSDRIRGLDTGADDYLVKPYDPEELLARLRAIERRRSAQASPVLQRGPVSIDLAREVVKVDSLPVVLTPKEWALLRVLASRPEQTFTRERLLEALYQWDSTSDSNTLEVFISRLRRKLGSPLIQTVRGTGYRLAVA